MGSSSVPLVDVQIARHVRSQTRRGRRPSHGLQGKIVSPALLHTEVPEVEALRSKTVGAEERLRGGQVAAVAPWTGGDWRRVHGRERRRHLHDEVLVVVPGNGGGTSVCGPSSSSGLSLDGR
jgi:hypothetical protein